MTKTKKSLTLSVLALFLCIAMLIATTFAWFTDSVTSGKNTIKAGNLDVELLHYTTSQAEAETVQGETDLFNIDLWEPGAVAYENFVVKNVGTLALKYRFKLNTAQYNSYKGHNLTEVLKVAVVPGGFTGDRAAAQAREDFVPLSSFTYDGKGYLAPNTTDNAFGIVIYWEPTDHDNDYNVNNGGEVDTLHGDLNELFVDFGVDLFATQKEYEKDSFDENYDKTAADFSDTDVKPIVKPLIIPTTPESEGKIVREPAPDETLTLNVENQDMTVTYAVGTKLTDDTVVAADKKTADAKLGFEFKSEKSGCGVTIGSDQKLANYELTLNIAQDNAILNKVTKIIPKNLCNVKVYHASTTPMAKLDTADSTPAENTESFFYDSSTGLLTLWVFHSSEVDVTYDQPELELLKNNEHVAYLTLAEFRDNVNKGTTYEGYVVKQLKDINLKGSGHTWTSIGYPNIGSYEATRPFKGIYDGDDHKITNLYRHCYNAEDIGDTTGGNLAGPYGLFGCVQDATIKNLTIDGATLVTETGNQNTTFTTGAFVATAFGDSTFENLTAKNVKITGYIDSCGIIVGGVTQGNFVFDHIIVDVTNEVNTHDWGYWSSCDCHMGGIVGTIDIQDSPTSGLKTSHVTIRNSEVAAKIMQMNDVMSSYAWYQYRCSGMLVGGFTINHADGLWNNCDDVSDARLATALTCEGVNVTYDKWNQQNYCRAEIHIPGTSQYSGEHLGRKPALGHCDGCKGDDLIVFDQLVGGWAGGTWKYEPGQTYKALDGVTVNYLNNSKPVIE